MKIEPYLKLMVEKDASDLFFTPGAPVKIKIEGRISSIGKTELNAESCRAAVYSTMSEEQIQAFQEEFELDFALSQSGIGRFRVNAFYQRGQPAMVLRHIKTDIPTLDGLGMPRVLADLIMNKRGIILMVGATGSGKSTTLAAMINQRNENASGHIVTIEDPIEFVHRHKKSLINQRELGIDTKSYQRALRSVLREAPDVILIGEVRDRDTMESTIQLAGTGHLAISTLHANNAYQAMQRIRNMFPQEMHRQLYQDLATDMRAIISQRLVRGRDGRRVAAVEILINTPYVSELIQEGRLSDIREAMENSSEGGTQSFDNSLLQLYRAGKIEMDEALANADSSANLQARISFG